MFSINNKDGSGFQSNSLQVPKMLSGLGIFQPAKFGENAMIVVPPQLPKPDQSKSTSTNDGFKKPGKPIKTKKQMNYFDLDRFSEMDILTQNPNVEKDNSDSKLTDIEKSAKLSEEIQAQRTKVRTLILKKEKELMKTKSELELTQEEKSTFNETNHSLLDENNILKTELANKNGEIKNLSSKVAKAKELLSSHTCKMNELKETMNKIQQMKSTIQIRKDEKKKFDEYLQQIEKEYKNEIKSVENDLRTTRTQLDQLKNDYFKWMVETVQIKATLNENKAKSNADLKQLMKIKKKAEAENLQLKDSCGKSNAEMSALTEKSEALSKETIILQEKNAQMFQMESANAEISSQIDQLKLKLNQLESQKIDDLKQALQKANDALNSTHMESENAKEQIETLKKSQESLPLIQTRLSEMITSNEEFHQIVRNKDDTIKDLKQKNEDYVELIAKLQTEKDSLYQSLNDILNKADRVLSSSQIDSPKSSKRGGNHLKALSKSERDVAAKFPSSQTLPLKSPSKSILSTKSGKHKLPREEGQRKNVRFNEKGLPRYSAEKETNAIGMDMSFVKKTIDAEKTRDTSGYDSTDELDIFDQIFAEN